MLFFINAFALAGWALLPVLAVLLFKMPGRRRALAGLLVAVLAYQAWFYFPADGQFPAADYGPVDHVHVSLVSDPKTWDGLTEAQSDELLAVCNRVRASRSAWRHFFGGHQVDLSVYFSGDGADWSRTYLTCFSDPRRTPAIKKNGQIYYVWNGEGLYQELYAICEGK